jgi:type IV pilus assembly protein PilC
MLLSYKLKSKEGKIEQGVIEAVDRFALARDIRSRGDLPLSIHEKKVSSFDAAFALEKIFSRVKNAELILLTKNLSGMIKAGLSLSRAFSVLEKQTKNAKLHKIIVSLEADIASGEPLSSALGKFPTVFSRFFVSMVKAGEESGNLSGSLTDIGINLEKSNSLTKKVKGALIYPGVILSAMVIIGILMFAFVVPTLASTFKEIGVKMPLSTRIIIFIGNFFSNHLILTFLILFAAVLGLMTLLRMKFMAKYIDFAVLRLPMIGVMAKELNTARTARTMSSLLLSGVSITRAVEITTDVVQNVHYKKVLEEAKLAVEKGATFSSVFVSNPKLFPVMMSEMVEVGEETGKLSDMLLQVSSFYEEEIENKTKNLSTIIEPVLMLLIGGGVGFFAISMITPLYSVLNDIK